MGTNRALAAMLAVAAVGLGTVAEAQFAPRYGGGMMGRGGYGYGAGMMGSAGAYCDGLMGFGSGVGYADAVTAVQAALTELHHRLGIGGAQQGAWDAFAAAVADQALLMQQFHGQVLRSTGTAPERVAQHAEFLRQRAQAATALAEATAALYEALTPAQRTLLDQGFAGCVARGGAGPFGN